MSAFGDDEGDAEIAHNLWRNSRLLLPNTLNLRRWATFLRVCFLVNLFVLPIDIFFYHAQARRPETLTARHAPTLERAARDVAHSRRTFTA